MKIAAVQMKPIFLERRKNLDKIEDFCHQIDADIIVFPELATSGYYFHNKKQIADIAENPSNSDFFKRFAKISNDKKSAIAIGFPEITDNEELFNSSVLFLPNEKYVIYRKIHLFFEEKLYFKVGNLPLQVVTFNGVKIGMMICFDWIFPEVSRKLMLKGSQIICHLSNLVMPYCQNAMPTRALENRLFIITANRIGKEQKNDKELIFTGESIICSFDSSVLAKASINKEEIISTEIEPSKALNKNLNQYNNILDDLKL